MADDTIPQDAAEAKKAARKAKRQQYMKDWRAANKDRFKATCDKWKANNPEKNAASKAAYRERNREKIRENGMAYYFATQPEKAQIRRDRSKDYAARNAETLKAKRDANRPALRARSKAYASRHADKIKAQRAAKKAEVSVRMKAARRENPQAVRAKERAYYTNKPEVLRVKHRNRRARKQAAGGRHSAADIEALFKLQKGRCAYCRASLKKAKHVDHIKPLALGGSNNRSNLQLLCPSCNCSKGAKHPIDYAKILGLLV